MKSTLRRIALFGLLMSVAIIFQISASANPSVGAQPRSDLTPLLTAIGYEDEARVYKLLKEGANPDDPTAGRSPLIQALTLSNGTALRCNLPILRLLLRYGADPNRADPRIGSLPLLTAFAIGDVSCAEALRAAGAAANSRDKGGHTILHSAIGAAARSGNVSIIDVAMNSGVNINTQSDDGYTALHEAVRIKNVPVIKALLQRGADACIKNRLDQTPLDMAINLRRDPELVAVLRGTRCTSGSQNLPP